MKPQLKIKLSAFIFIMMMFSFSLLQAQIRHSGNNPFLSKHPLKSSYQYGKIPSFPNKVCIESQHTIGGSGDEDRGAIKPIYHGYITCGSTNSRNGNFHVPAGHDFDAYIVKLNDAGNIVWAHTYGGSGYDDFNDIISTTDGGFVAIGASTSSDGDLKGNHGDEDVWVVKLDANGKIQWQKNYGGVMEDHGNTILETPNGYVFSAGSASSDGDLTFSHGDLDAWIVKISASGKILFQKTYGGSDYEDADGLYFNAANGTIIFSCETLSNDQDVTGAHGGLDAWVVKIDDSGNIIWKKTLGGTLDDGHDGLTRTSDGNIVIASTSHSFDGDVAGNNGLIVMWLLKLNAANGNIIWNKTFANPAELGAFGIFATADGGAVALGATGNSQDGATFDALALKVDTRGNPEWLKIFGGSGLDYAEFGAEAPNGDIITSNYTESNDGDVHKAYGGADTWIVVFDNCSNKTSNTGIEQKNAIVSSEGITNDGQLSMIIYPDPVSVSATILFTLLQLQKISIRIFDMNGRVVKILADGIYEKGQHELQWNVSGVNAGAYILQFYAGAYGNLKKLVVIK
jgi:hypothetical protein